MASPWSTQHQSYDPRQQPSYNSYPYPYDESSHSFPSHFSLDRDPSSPSLSPHTTTNGGGDFSLPSTSYNSTVTNAVESSLWQASHHSPPPVPQPLWINTGNQRDRPSVAPISDLLSRSDGHSHFDPQWLNEPGKTVGDALHTLTSGSPTSPVSANGAWGSYAERVQAFDESVAASSHVTKVKPFISKLVHLLNNPESYADCITWDDSGSCFIVSHANPRLLQVVLPKMFQHANTQSFTRQLNVYDFRRLPLPEVLAKLDLKSTSSSPTTGDYSGWSHPHFRRDDLGNLEQMTPRPSKARLQKKVEKEQRKRKEFAR